MCAYIVAKPYIPMYGLAKTHKKVEIVQSPNLQHLVMLSVTLCTNFCGKWTMFDKVIIKN